MYIFHCQSRARLADSYDVASTCTMWKYQRHERVAKLGHILCTESTASVYWDASQEELPCTVAYQTKLVSRKGTGLNNCLVARALTAKYIFIDALYVIQNMPTVSHAHLAILGVRFAVTQGANAVPRKPRG
jgi:hypothetical protein